MAHSMRNGLQPQPAPENELAAPEDDMTLTVGHACLASQCWLGARRIGSRKTSDVVAARLGVVLSLRRAAPPCGRHCPRPSQPAEARFTSAEGQFLTK